MYTWLDRRAPYMKQQQQQNRSEVPHDDPLVQRITTNDLRCGNKRISSVLKVNHRMTKKRPKMSNLPLRRNDQNTLELHDLYACPSKQCLVAMLRRETNWRLRDGDTDLKSTRCVGRNERSSQTPDL